MNLQKVFCRVQAASCDCLLWHSSFAYRLHTMSSLYHLRSTLPSQPQIYSPATDYIDVRRSFHGDSRLPLRDTTANAQAHSLNGVVSCYQSPMALSPSMQSNIPTSIVPSQSFDSLYRLQTPRQQPRFQRRGRNGVNPLYFWPAFRQYRNRQAHKDTQKDKGGVWRRPELEDAFVDGMWKFTLAV